MNAMVCGVDEAGRGPLAGPVYAAAVILDPTRRVNGLADSKALTAERREILAVRVKERAIAWSIAHATVEEIDRLNIFHASMLAMRRAVAALHVAPDEAWIDGNHCPKELRCPARAFVDGDAKHKVISAASILAKTARDAEMRALHDRYPGYGFDGHKGYGTPEHLDALGRLGPSPVHRRSFYAVGVFSQADLFSGNWQALEETMRVRSYRMHCEATKACATGFDDLAEIERLRRRLKRDYADLFSCPQTAGHVERVEEMLRESREQLRAQRAKAKA